MQTHNDQDANQSDVMALFHKRNLEELEKKAAQMMAAGESKITAGAPGEVALHEELVGQIMIRRLPEDPLCLRISIGEAHTTGDSAYLVFRGRHQDCLELLERAVCAMKIAHCELTDD